MCSPTQQVWSELQHCNLVCSALGSETFTAFFTLTLSDDEHASYLVEVTRFLASHC